MFCLCIHTCTKFPVNKILAWIINIYHDIRKEIITLLLPLGHISFTERLWSWCISPPWSIPPPAERWKRHQDGISRVQKVAAVEIGFRGAPGCFQGIWVYIGGRSRSVEPRGAHEGGGRAQEGRGAPCLVDTSFVSWRPLQVLWITFVPKIALPKVSFRLDSVWYSFSVKHWNRQKNSNLYWALG